MRHEIESRPLLAGCICLILGLTLRMFPINLLALGLFVWALRPPTVRMLGIGFAFLGAALSPHPSAALENAVRASGTGVVSAVPRLYEGRQAMEVDTSIGRLRLSTPSGELVAYGDRVSFRGTVKPPNEQNRDYWLLKGVVGSVWSEDVQVVRAAPWIFRLGAQWRNRFIEFTSSTLPPSVAHAVDALCFNVDGLLDPLVMSDLRRTGTVHLISASGLHVMIFAFALAWGLRFLPVPRSVQLVLLVLILAVYATATGMRPPVLRAVVMALVMLYAYLLGRESDALSALALSAILYLLWRPSGVFDAGFQLSFVIVAGLSLWWKPLPSLERASVGDLLAHRAKLLARTSTHAFVWSSPLLAYHFGSLSLIAVPSNVLLVPFVPLVIVPALGGLFAAALAPGPVDAMMGLLVGPITQYILGVGGLMASLPFAAIEVPEFSGYWVALFYLLLILSWSKHVRKP